MIGIMEYLTEFVFFQSAIGEGMTRRDHSDVSNQVVLICTFFF